MDPLYSTRQLVNEGVVPLWLAEHIRYECTCTFPILMNRNLTVRKCSNPYCIEHMKQRASLLCTRLGIAGYGPENCEKLLRQIGACSHFDILPYLLEEKPAVHLYQIAQMAFITDYSGKLEDILRGYQTFEQYFQTSGIPVEILAHKDELIEAEKYFKVKRALSAKCITVMITDPIPGYKRREMFIDECNDILGDFVSVKLVGKRISGVNYLITVNPGTESQKAIIARENHIPIVSPSEFRKILAYKVEETLNSLG